VQPELSIVGVGAMARYPVTYRRRRCLARISERQTFAAQGNDLARKVVVDATVALGIRIGANYFCRRSNPDYALCKAFDDAANEQAEKLHDSLLGFGAWGAVALVAALFDGR
jgi:hypothetical protein